MSAIFEEHRAYISDPIRLARFQAAVEKVVRPGDVVADLGCGFGVLGLLCLKAGAARVYGIDSTRAIEIARETFRRAGLADRYVCVPGLTSQIDLPEPADVAICDHVGCFGFDYGVAELLAEARARFLRPGGAVIPLRLDVNLAAVESPERRARFAVWEDAETPDEYRWLRGYEANLKHLVPVQAGDLITAPASLGSIVLGTDASESLAFTAELRVARDCLIDGLCGWFDCELAEGVAMTNSPLAANAIRREQAFLPIESPLSVKEGDLLKATVTARPAESIIVWTLEAPAAGRRFAHSTWESMVLTKDDLATARRRDPVRLSRIGDARKIILELCDGTRSRDEIVSTVLRGHPDLFPTAEETSRFVHATIRRNVE